MILRTIQLQSSLESRGSFKCDLLGIGTAIGAAINTAGQIAINDDQLALQKAMFKDQMNQSSEQFYKNLEFQHKMTYLNQDFQREMWQRQIDYNDPSAQMQRLVDAGINPNSAAAMMSPSGAAVSGQVSAPSGGTGSVPSGSVPHLSNPMESIGNMVGDLLANQAAKQNIDNVKADTYKKEAETRNIEEQTRGIIIDNDWKPFEKQSNIDQAYAKIDLMIKQGDLADADATQIREMLPYLKDLNVAQQRSLFAECQKTAVEIGQIQANAALLREQIETEKYRQKQLDAAAYQAFMAGEQSKSVIQYNGKLMGVAEAEQQLKEIEAQGKFATNRFNEYLRVHGIDPNNTGNVISQITLTTADASGRVLSPEEIKTKWDNYYKAVYGAYDDTQLRLHSFSGTSLGSGFR